MRSARGENSILVARTSLAALAEPVKQSESMNTKASSILPRRHFLRRTSSAAAGAALLAQLPIERFAFGAANSDTLKLALVGCGGRGAGAADQALNADTNVKLVAMADVQDDKLQTGPGAPKK